MLKKILVPLDGSKLAEAVLPFVHTLAQSMKAEIVLLRVVTVETYTSMPVPMAPVSIPPLRVTPEHDYYAHAEGYLQRVAFDYFPDSAVTLQVGGGPITDSILEFAETAGVDLIAMSTHGRSGLSRMVLGSVTDEVVRRSHVPVLLIRPEHEES